MSHPVANMNQLVQYWTGLQGTAAVKRTRETPGTQGTQSKRRYVRVKRRETPGGAQTAECHPSKS